jgi:hypothetical protein
MCKEYACGGDCWYWKYGWCNFENKNINYKTEQSLWYLMYSYSKRRKKKQRNTKKRKATGSKYPKNRMVQSSSYICIFLVYLSKINFRNQGLSLLKHMKMPKHRLWLALGSKVELNNVSTTCKVIFFQKCPKRHFC